MYLTVQKQPDEKNNLYGNICKQILVSNTKWFCKI